MLSGDYLSGKGDRLNDLHLKSHNMLLKMLCDLENYKRKPKRKQKLLKRQKGFVDLFQNINSVQSLEGN